MANEMTNLDQQIDTLIRGPQYAMPQAEKDAALTPILVAACRDVARRCPAYLEGTPPAT